MNTNTQADLCQMFTWFVGWLHQVPLIGKYVVCRAVVWEHVGNFLVSAEQLLV